MLDIFYIFCYHTSMKVKSKLFIILIVFCIIVMMSCGIVVAFAASAEGIDINPTNVEFTHDAVITLTLVDDHYEVTGCNNDKIINNEVIIPDTYNGKPVTIIATGAFNQCTNLHYLVLGENVTTISAKSINAINLIAIDVPCNNSNQPSALKNVEPLAFFRTTAFNSNTDKALNFCVKGYATYNADGKRNNSETAMTDAATNFFAGVSKIWRFQIYDTTTYSWWSNATRRTKYHYFVDFRKCSALVGTSWSSLTADQKVTVTSNLLKLASYKTVWVYDNNSQGYGDGNELKTFSQIYRKLSTLDFYNTAQTGNYIRFGFVYSATVGVDTYDYSLYRTQYQWITNP